MTKYSRRQFLGVILGTVAAGSVLEGCRKQETGTAASGGDIEKLVRKAVDDLGGISAFVKKGQIVAVKPNASFSTLPTVGATTNPDVVAAVVKLALEAGAKEVRVIDHTLHEEHISYERTGIKKAVEAAGAHVISINDFSAYTEKPIPGGKFIKTHQVAIPYLEADVLINVPTCKHHSATRVSAGIKNLMGLVWDRGTYHGGDIDECLADLLSAIRPHLTIVDGWRTLQTNGPSGPGKVAEHKTILASADPVAADAKAVELFMADAGVTVKDVPYLAKAAERKLGSLTGKVSIAHA